MSSGPEGAGREADGSGGRADDDGVAAASASLAVEGLVAGYGEVIALDEVTVTAEAGVITAVLGANGAGKTTLLRAVSGLVRPRRGRVLLGGTDVAGRSPEQIVRAGIAHVPEGQGVIPELTVEENLRIGMMSWPARGIWGGRKPPPRGVGGDGSSREQGGSGGDRSPPRGVGGDGSPREQGGSGGDRSPPRGVWGDGSPREQGGSGGDRSPRGNRAARAAALDEEYARFKPLADRRRKLASTLSGGERQMLVIARALLARPRVLLLDEPSLGLAPRVMAQVMDLVVRLSREDGLTIVLVEQNARSALSIADHGVVLNLGRVVASAAAPTLAADVALRHHYLGF